MESMESFVTWITIAFVIGFTIGFGIGEEYDRKYPGEGASDVVIDAEFDGIIRTLEKIAPCDKILEYTTHIISNELKLRLKELYETKCGPMPKIITNWSDNW